LASCTSADAKSTVRGGNAESSSEPRHLDSGQHFYDRMWRRYGDLDAVSPAAFHRRRLVTKLALGCAPDARRILDVGCGAGGLLRQLVRCYPDAQLSGADVSAQALTDTRDRVGACDLFLLRLGDPDFTQTHAQRLGSFDMLLCSEVLEHVADDELAAGQLVSLVAPGGWLVITVPGGAMSRFDLAIGHQRHYRPRQLQALLERAGLEQCRVAAWGFPFHTAYRAAVRVASRLVVPLDAESLPQPGPRSRGVSGPWAMAYRALGKALRLLFYLNVSRWGQQLVALGRRPAGESPAMPRGPVRPGGTAAGASGLASQAHTKLDSPENRGIVPASSPGEGGIMANASTTDEHVQPSEDMIRAKAHQLWLERGCPEGSSEQDWYEAERLLIAEARHLARSQSAPRGKGRVQPKAAAEAAEAAESAAGAPAPVRVSSRAAAAPDESGSDNARAAKRSSVPPSKQSSKPPGSPAKGRTRKR
jgi:2-polyprenyl-3-methyl-5-hydroxy-6-metoxy-1,4-benzoquinol methylase